MMNELDMLKVKVFDNMIEDNLSYWGEEETIKMVINQGNLSYSEVVALFEEWAVSPETVREVVEELIDEEELDEDYMEG